jgi:transcriptional regulator with XRE-family HTH domain
VPNWRALRTALGMTQAQFAELLRVQRRTVLRWEAHGAEHMCAHPSTELLLESFLDSDELASKLDAVGFVNPFVAANVAIYGRGAPQLLT